MKENPLRVIYDKGIYLPEIDLWLDARRRCALSVISHAHADHIQHHQSIIATPATARIFEHRIKPTDALLLDFYETKDFGNFRLTFYPAGHVLGSAQTLIEYNGERLVYTGDFKLRTGLSCEPPEIVPCDTLVTECTFGQPQFTFPDDQQVHRLLCEHIDEAFKAGLQPVVFGYSLGKSQEALKILLRGGYSVAVHHSIMAIVDIYREMGVEFDGDYRPLDCSDTDGLVVLALPGARHGRALQMIERPYTIYLSGWGIDKRARYRYQTDVVLPLSDHAGFDDLERYAIASGARKVYTLYGDHTFAAHLRQRGMDAEHLHPLAVLPQTAAARKPSSKRPRRKDEATLSLFDLIESAPS
jgi:hypothetical protein